MESNGDICIKQNYKVIKIQELEPISTSESKQQYNSDDVKQRWKQTKCKHWDGKCTCNVLYYTENNPANVRDYSSNSFYGAFVNAYNNHEDVILSPDDIWMIICLHFSKYINKYPEEMRNQIVSHDGKKKLTVITGEETSESEWDEFFELIIDAIQKNTKDNITDTLKCAFTTTTKIEEIISIASIMDSFKAYFKYGRCIPCCGIKAARFMGTVEDWTNLLIRIDGLKKYDINGEWKCYIDGVLPIVNEFVDTFNGQVDVDWWNKVMNITHGPLGSGSTTLVSGWILKFFGQDGNVDVDDIKSYNFEVPVEIENYLTGTRKTVELIGGFGGVYKENGAYRPQLSMIVFYDGNVAPI